jgi:hypothetical protein
MTANDRALKYIAEHSPKSWASTIRRRFNWALNVLDCALVDLHKTQGESLLGRSKKYWHCQDEAGIGCPHCVSYQCRLQDGVCLYVEACQRYGLPKRIAYHCIDVRFGGHWLNEISSQTYVKVILSDKTISVECGANSGSPIDDIRQELKNCEKFCQAHVDWTRKYKWGSKLKKGSKR